MPTSPAVTVFSRRTVDRPISVAMANEIALAVRPNASIQNVAAR